MIVDFSSVSMHGVLAVLACIFDPRPGAGFPLVVTGPLELRVIGALQLVQRRDPCVLYCRRMRHALPMPNATSGLLCRPTFGDARTRHRQDRQPSDRVRWRRRSGLPLRAVHGIVLQRVDDPARQLFPFVFAALDLSARDLEGDLLLFELAEQVTIVFV